MMHTVEDHKVISRLQEIHKHRKVIGSGLGVKVHTIILEITVNIHDSTLLSAYMQS